MLYNYTIYREDIYFFDKSIQIDKITILLHFRTIGLRHTLDVHNIYTYFGIVIVWF